MGYAVNKEHVLKVRSKRVYYLDHNRVDSARVTTGLQTCVHSHCIPVQVWADEARVQSSVAMWLCKRNFSSSEARGGWMSVETYMLQKLDACPIWMENILESIPPLSIQDQDAGSWLLSVLSTAQLLLWVVKASCSQGFHPSPRLFWYQRTGAHHCGGPWWLQNIKWLNE